MMVLWIIALLVELTQKNRRMVEGQRSRGHDEIESERPDRVLKG